MKEQKNPISIDLSVAHENRQVNEQMRLLEDAINQKKIVQFQYTNNENQTRQIQVEPVSVIYKWYNWYLNGKITKEYDNGDFEFCLTVPEQETYWYGVILSMGSDIRIMEPQSVIKRILETCNQLKKEYEK